MVSYNLGSGKKPRFIETLNSLALDVNGARELARGEKEKENPPLLAIDKTANNASKHHWVDLETKRERYLSHATRHTQTHIPRDTTLLVSDTDLMPFSLIKIESRCPSSFDVSFLSLNRLNTKNAFAKARIRLIIFFPLAI